MWTLPERPRVHPSWPGGGTCHPKARGQEQWAGRGHLGDMYSSGKPHPWPKESAAWLWALEAVLLGKVNRSRSPEGQGPGPGRERPLDIRDACTPGAPRGWQDRQWVAWKEATVTGPHGGIMLYFWVQHGVCPQCGECQPSGIERLGTHL